MKRAVLPLATALVLVAAAIFALMERQTYTNRTASSDFMQSIQVAELPEPLAKSTAQEMREVLPQSPMVVRVEATGQREYLFGIKQQQVRVLEVFQGEDIHAGEAVWLYASHWGSPDFNDSTMNMGFINDLQAGEEYLVFLSGKMDLMGEKRSIYQLTEVGLVAPAFRYGNCRNTVIPVSGETTYVDYCLVAENEFFGCTEQAIQTLQELKQTILSLYSK